MFSTDWTQSHETSKLEVIHDRNKEKEQILERQNQVWMTSVRQDYNGLH